METCLQNGLDWKEPSNIKVRYHPQQYLRISSRPVPRPNILHYALVERFRGACRDLLSSIRSL